MFTTPSHTRDKHRIFLGGDWDASRYTLVDRHALQLLRDLGVEGIAIERGKRSGPRGGHFPPQVASVGEGTNTRGTKGLTSIEGSS